MATDPDWAIAMDRAFLTRIGRTTDVLGALTFLFVAVYYDVRFGLGVLVGCLWGIANFAVLAALITATIRPGPVNRRRALIVAAVKFPALYFVGWLILRTGWFAPVALVLGFSLLFLVTLFKALGRWYLQLDDRRSTAANVPNEPSTAPR